VWVKKFRGGKGARNNYDNSGDNPKNDSTLNTNETANNTLLFAKYVLLFAGKTYRKIHGEENNAQDP
jgi:hypothetical protein